MSQVFVATVWPFAKNRLDEICCLIEQKYSIIHFEKFDFDVSWPKLVGIVYADDKIKPSKLLPKVEVLSKFSKYVYLLYIEVPDPEYYFKPDGRRMSGSMAELKKLVRSKFGPKREADKNPLHIPDRVEHSDNYKLALEKIRC